MRTFVAALVFSSIYGVLGTAASAEPLPADQTARIDAIVAKTIARAHVPAASIAIARDGEIVYAHGYGLRDLETKSPADGSTVFEIGSITKQFTAASVMLLVQAGKIELDAPIATYLPNVPFGKTITVRNLLTHTSGLANYTELKNFMALAQRPASPTAVVASIAKLPLAFAPGTKWEYSNTNYVVLGMLVEKVSGESYPTFVRTRVIEPLHLTQTRYSNTYLTSGNVAYPYEVDGAVPRRVKALLGLDWAYSAGGLWSSAPDLVRWEDALYSGRVVDASSLAAMTTPAHLKNGESTAYGFGLMTSTVGGQREIWHNGGLPGYSTIDAYFPDQHLEIAVLGNALTFEPEGVVRSVLAALVPSVATTLAATANATPAPGEDAAMTRLATSLLAQAQSGKVDRTLLSARMNAALTADLIAGVSSQLAPLGKPKAITFLRKADSDGYRSYVYRIVWDAVSLDESFAIDGDGKIAGWLFRPSQDATPTGTATAPTASSTP